MFKGLDFNAEVTVYKQSFSISMLMGLSNAEVSILQNVAKKDDVIYGVDIRILARLVHVTSPNVIIPITDDMRTCFARGQVPFETGVLKETVLGCNNLFNWINNTHARVAFALAARYIRACYTRERYIPPIPLCLMQLYDVTAWKMRAEQYYRNVWKCTTMNMTAKKNIFTMCSRGTFMFIGVKGYGLGSNDLPLELDSNDRKWPLLSMCENVFDMIVLYEKMMRTEYVVSPIGYKKHKIDGNGGGGGGVGVVTQTGSYTQKSELFAKFCHWVMMTHPGKDVVDPLSRRDKVMQQFHSRLLWILVEEPLESVLEYQRPHGLMVVPSK